jgi:hypothetical protein
MAVEFGLLTMMTELDLLLYLVYLNEKINITIKLTPGPLNYFIIIPIDSPRKYEIILLE